MNSKIFFFILAILLMAPFANAAGIIGASPAALSFNKVLRGGYAEKPLAITYGGTDPLKVTMNSRDEIASWINVSRTNFTIEGNSLEQIIISVQPPTDVPNGNYEGVVQIKAEPKNAAGKEGHATGTIIGVLEVAITVEIVDQEAKACTASQFTVDSVEQNEDLVFKVNVTNDGNIRISPEVSIEIWDQEQINLIKADTFFVNSILPTKTVSAERKVQTTDLETGQYWAKVSAAECLSEDLLTFDILEPGTLKADGIFMTMYGPPKAQVGDTLPITAVFKNTGQKDVEAQFKGRVEKEGKIVQVLESEKISVPINEKVNFTLYFTPQKDGKYVARGRIFYDKKRTFELSTPFSVIAKKNNLTGILLTAMYVVVILIILTLIYKVRKERRRLSRMIKGI